MSEIPSKTSLDPLHIARDLVEVIQSKDIPEASEMTNLELEKEMKEPVADAINDLFISHNNVEDEVRILDFHAFVGKYLEHNLAVLGNIIGHAKEQKTTRVMIEISMLYSHIFEQYLIHVQENRHDKFRGKTVKDILSGIRGKLKEARNVSS